MAPRHYFLPRVGSTLDAIHELAADGAEDGTLVVAEEQLAGRGTRGRTWHSPIGGLWLSQLARPRTSAGLDLLSVRVGLAVADALDHLGGLPQAMLKWPNDLLLAGRKVGGILCEARWQGESLTWVAIGLGLNVRNPLPAEVRGVATRLAEWRPDLTPGSLLDSIAGRLRGLSDRPGRLEPTELESLARRDWLRGRRLIGPEPGVAEGISAEGPLLVRRLDGTLATVRAGTVELAE